MKTVRNVSIIALVIALLLAIKFIFIPTASEAPKATGGAAPAMGVNAIIAKASSINEQVYVSGSVLANESVELHPEVSGKLMQLLFAEGSRVNKGDLLIKINDVELQAQLRKNDLEKKLAEEKLKRNEKLLQLKGISQEEYDALQNTVAALLADRDVLLAQVAKTEIRAPFSGMIGLKSVSEGSYVTPQTLIANLQQLDPAKIDFAVPERYSAFVKKGDEIIFTSGNSKKQYIGKIYAIEPQVTNATRTVQLRALCANSNAELLPGAFARIILKLKQENDALMIPTQCIVPILKGQQVYVYRNGKSEAVKVETGIRNDSTIQIISGLKPNDTIVSTGMMGMKSGIDLKITTLK